MVRVFTHGAIDRRIYPSWMDSLSYFSFQPGLHDWCIKGCGMSYPVCGVVYKKPNLPANWKEKPFTMSDAI